VTLIDRGPNENKELQTAEKIQTISNFIIPCNTVVLEKLIVPQLLRKFSAFCRTPTFLTVFQKACHLFLP
jgi:hypothetical protein